MVPSTSEVKHTIPPNALTGSPAHASSKDFKTVSETAKPQGFKCFTIATATFSGIFCTA